MPITHHTHAPHYSLSWHGEIGTTSFTFSVDLISLRLRRTKPCTLKYQSDTTESTAFDLSGRKLPHVLLVFGNILTEVIFKTDLAISLLSKSRAWFNGQSNDGIVAVVNHKTFPFGEIRIQSAHCESRKSSNNTTLRGFIGEETFVCALERKVSIRKIFPSLFVTRRRAIN